MCAEDPMVHAAHPCKSELNLNNSADVVNANGGESTQGMLRKYIINEENYAVVKKAVINTNVRDLLHEENGILVEEGLVDELKRQAVAGTVVSELQPVFKGLDTSLHAIANNVQHQNDTDMMGFLDG